MRYCGDETGGTTGLGGRRLEEAEEGEREGRGVWKRGRSTEKEEVGVRRSTEEGRGVRRRDEEEDGKDGGKEGRK